MNVPGSNERLFRQAPRIMAQLVGAASAHLSVSFALSDPYFDHQSADTVIVLSRRGRIIELNLTSALIWELLQAEMTMDQLVGRVRSVFRVTADLAAEDVKNVLDILSENGFCDVINGG